MSMSYAVFRSFALVKDIVMPAHLPLSGRIVVVGVDSLLAREILMVCAERDIPFSQLVALDSRARAGREVSYGEDHTLKVGAQDSFSFQETDRVILATKRTDAASVAARASQVGARVVDTSGHFRADPKASLSIAAVCGDDQAPLIAAPSGAALMLLRALAPLHQQFGVSRVVASLYTSSAHLERDGMDELFRQTRGIYVNEPTQSSRELFPKQIAFNAIPQVGAFHDEGVTEDEHDTAAQVSRILGQKDSIHINSAYIAAFVGTAAYVNVHCEKPIVERDMRGMFADDPAVSVVDHRVEEGYVTPVETLGEDSVFISRIRRDKTVTSGVSFWCVADTTRHEALNIVDLVCATCHQQAISD